MKQLTLIFLSLLLCVGVGCNFLDSQTEQEVEQDRTDFHYTTVIVDGCEYLSDKYRSDVPLVHKGNCNNPIHTTH